MIQAVHTRVPGRGRFRVDGLRGSDALKMTIEARLSEMTAILEVFANPVTGNVLVRFNSDNDHQSIAVLMEGVLSDAVVLPSGGRPERGIQSDPESRHEQSRLKAVDKIVAKKVKSLLDWHAPQTERDWHTLECGEALAILETNQSWGLTGENALERLDRYGPNRLPEPKSRSKWDIFKDQFVNLPTALLGAAAGVSILTGGILDAVVIAGVVAANGVIGYFVESEAERTISSLKSYVKPHAKVLRDGKAIDISAEEVVPGDVVVFRPGYYVPADCRMLEASNLSIDESALTGESMPVYKDPERLELFNMPMADRVNMAYMGTLVTGGEGIAIAVATGQYTEFGKLQLLLGETTTPETPIEKQLGRIGDQLVLACIGICGIVFAIGFLRGNGALQMLKMAISLAAAAVPEGLPAAATINFALGVSNMRRHNVLVRHLQAIETLGAVQTVCMDKTGTITYNRMSLVQINVDGTRIEIEEDRCVIEGDPMEIPALDHLLNVCSLCSDVRVKRNGGDEPELAGSPTELALVRVAINSGVDIGKLRKDYPLVKVENRAENRLYMATLHQSPNGDGQYYAVKGSPSEVLDMCKYKMNGGKPIPFTDEERLKVETENERMSGDALRVLGVAFANIDGESDFNHEEDLTWLGLVGMVDPIRESAPHLIEMYHSAGIETVMITGDQSPTAYAVAGQLKLNKGDKPIILDSTELIALDDDVMEALAKKVDVYSRVSPSHKLKIVQALQSVGKVVAMTGDGINDSPALKAADIGIAMGQTGTDVAREVADVVLQDDNLETLVIAVRDGRTTYNNIRKSLRFFLATNMSEIMIMFTSMAAGTGSPLSVMQLLWINIISDIFPGLSLSMEEPEGDALSQPPRDPDAPILGGDDFKRMAVESASITAGAMGAYGYGLFKYGPGIQASSLAFQGLTLAQLLHAVSCRSEHTSIFSSGERPRNKYFDAAIWGSVGLQVLTMFVPPLRSFLGVVRPGLADIGVITASSLLPLAVNELTKGTGKKESV